MSNGKLIEHGQPNSVQLDNVNSVQPNSVQLDNVNIIQQPLDEYKKEYDDLVTIINQLNQGPQQRSKEWYEIRKLTIGGSEIATILGLNPYCSIREFLIEKTLSSSFSGSLATRWGTVFENVTKVYAEKLFSMPNEIIITGSINGAVEHQRYSPDGIGLVQLVTADGRYMWVRVLFEFKSPFSSIPNGLIPEHYKPQVFTGLASMPFIDNAIFINNCYRKCRLNDMNKSSEYNTTFHKGKYPLDTTPVAFGMLMFYQTFENLKKNSKSNLYAAYKSILIDSYNDPIDFGASDDQFQNDTLFKLVTEDKVKMEMSKIYFNKTAIAKNHFVTNYGVKTSELLASDDIANDLRREYNSFLATCDERKNVIIGYLSWKLMKSDIIMCYHDEKWVETLAPAVDDVIKKIVEINKLPQTNRVDKINEMYPPKTSQPKTTEIAVDATLGDLQSTLDMINLT